MFKAPMNFYHKSLNVENIQRMHANNKEHKEQRTYNKLIAKDLSQFRSKDLSVHFPIEEKRTCV